jgi:hypothetical protein
MTKKKHPKLRNPKLKHAFSELSDFRDILAIVEGRFGEPVKRSGNFINASYPPDDVSQEELEKIWGDPKDIPKDFAEKIREDARKRMEGRKHKSETSFQ